MKVAFIIVAIILFVLAALSEVIPNSPTWRPGLTNLGLAFFAASFAPLG